MEFNPSNAQPDAVTAMAVGIAFGVLAGFVLDRIMAQVAARREARAGKARDDDESKPGQRPELAEL